VQELLTPFEQTAFLCKMIYLPPFAIHGTHKISKEEKNLIANQYRNILDIFVKGDFIVNDIKKFSYLNDWIESVTTKNYES
jgi:glutathione-regulated potassium-efflux system ancillary protein KefG